MAHDPGRGPDPVREVRELVVRTVGDVPAALAADVTARVSRSVLVPCRLGAPVAQPTGGDVPGRDQWDADRLLEHVERDAAAPGRVTVALAARDMGNVVFTHFFGRARLHGTALVVSLARLRPEFQGLAPDAPLTARRAAVEVLHELGHVLGLPHCDGARCLMRLARNVEAIDVRGGAFCAACADVVRRAAIVRV